MRGEAGEEASVHHRAAEQVPLLPMLQHGDAQATQPQDSQYMK